MSDEETTTEEAQHQDTEASPEEKRERVELHKERPPWEPLVVPEKPLIEFKVPPPDEPPPPQKDSKGSESKEPEKSEKSSEGSD